MNVHETVRQMRKYLSSIELDLQDDPPDPDEIARQCAILRLETQNLENHARDIASGKFLSDRKLASLSKPAASGV